MMSKVVKYPDLDEMDGQQLESKEIEMLEEMDRNLAGQQTAGHNSPSSNEDKRNSTTVLRKPTPGISPATIGSNGIPSTNNFSELKKM